MKTQIFKFASLLLTAGMLASFNLILNVNNCYSQNFEWAKGSDGIYGNIAYAVDADASGNVYTTGYFEGTMTFGGQTFVSNGGRDMYIAKHNSSGGLEWFQILGEDAYDNGLSIACSGNDVYVLGYVNYQLYLMKYNSAGVVLWSRSVDNGTINIFDFHEIETDASGNCYIAGSFEGYATIDNTTLVSYGGTDVFTAKYNSSGVFQWVKSGGGISSDEANGIGIDGNGDIYVTGNFRESVSFGSINLSTPANTGASFIIKYDQDGNEIRGTSFGGATYFDTRGIGVDAAGNSYITGGFKGTAAFGNINLANSGDMEIFIAKYDNSGTISWAKKEGKYNNALYGNAIKTGLNGDCLIYGNYSGIASFGDFTLTGVGSYIVKYDNTGRILWATNVNSLIYGHNRIFGISSDASGNVYITGEFYHNSAFGNIVLTCTWQNIFVSKLNNQTNLISGNVFIDYDNDGIQDSGEPLYPGQIISYDPGSVTALANSSGIYNMFSGLGNFNISIPNPPLYYTVNPVINTAGFSAYGLTDENNNFGLHPAPGMNDLKVTLTENSRSRPGFDMTQNITYDNKGTTTLSGTVVIEFDSRLDYKSSLTNPLPTRVDLTNHKLEWDYFNLPPVKKENIIIGYNIPATIAIGTILSTTGRIDPVISDLVPSDNEQTIMQTVNGSYDPNDKNVSPAGSISSLQVSNADQLTYTIRFQNTGTDTAFTVMVLDTLSSLVNKASIEMLSSSHSYNYSISSQGVIKWTFNNILLPDSTTNEPLSHGFIKYRIRPMNNLVIGDEIRNTAYIYFDYNVPVITNTTLTPVQNPSKVLKINWRSEGMFPNPDSTGIYIRRSVAPFDILDTAAGISTHHFIIPPIYTISVPIESSLTESYFIVIKHRNSVETWSADPVSISQSDTTSYDFTTNQSNAYGNNMKLTGTVWSVYSGDVNQDGAVDLTDVIFIYNEAASFATGYRVTDLNGNNMTDLSDLLIAYNNAADFVTMKRP